MDGPPGTTTSGGSTWKLPGMVHAHPEVRQQWFNTAEGMQKAIVCKTSKKANNSHARVNVWEDTIKMHVQSNTEDKSRDRGRNLPGIVNM